MAVGAMLESAHGWSGSDGLDQADANSEKPTKTRACPDEGCPDQQFACRRRGSVPVGG